MMSEEQQIAVGVLDFKSPQAIVAVLEWQKELDVPRGEFRRQGTRIRDVEK